MQLGWNKGAERENGWETLLEKTKACRSELQKWQKVTFKRADQEINRLKGVLNALLNQQSANTDWNRVKEIQRQIEVLWKQEETYWGQRSRIKWLNWGDKNSKFFHASTIQRRERNRILRIKDGDGEWVEGQEGITEAILKHYGEVYNSDPCPVGIEFFQHMPVLVSPEMNDTLLLPFSDLDVKFAVDSLGASKAPGPDGFNGLFYQKNWESIKKEVCSAVLGFFSNGTIPLELNETLVSLVPKIPMPESINHLRPISCCNFIYKVISKLMVLRLKGFLGSLVSQNQSAFVGGRLIQDNLVVAQEMFHSLKNRNKGGNMNVAIKLDMNKAYDRLEWHFLERILLTYGFCPRWVSLVMKLVSTVSYTYKINGLVSQKIIPQRGLRQGDPLSPYLFILAADALSHLINRASSSGLIKGVQLARGAPTLTHLFFADDAVLFAQANEEEI